MIFEGNNQLSGKCTVENCTVRTQKQDVCSA